MPALPRLPRPAALDWLALALLLAGALCVATGLLPTAAAGDVLSRIAPLLAFLATVVVLAELTAQARVFDVIAAGVARLAGGSYPALFGLCVAFAALTTTVLNLDTTAVLLTPVMIALAVRVGIEPAPLAMTTVWLANTASLLLPVSNLTNLLAQGRIGLDPGGFAARMWPAQLASVLLTAAFLWAFHWRPARPAGGRYSPPPAPEIPDRVLCAVAGAACVAFVVAILIVDAALWVASGGAALVVVASFALRDRSALRPALFPWRLLVFVTGLFLVVETVSRHGLTGVMVALVGSSGDAGGLLRTAFAGAGLANLVNNLPAYLAGESAVPVGRPDQLLALLVGVNVGPLVAPWASLATLLWYERCQAAGVRIPVLRFALTGAALALTAVAAATLTLAR